jgi:hypothetical protein
LLDSSGTGMTFGIVLSFRYLERLSG